MSIDNVQDISPRVQYVAAPAQTAFDYPFPIFQDADLVVVVDGETQALDTDYTVSGEGEDNGGTVTFSPALSGGELVTFYRVTAIEREADYQQNGPWSSRATNDELDKLYVIAQELDQKIDRSLRIPFTAEVDDEDTLLAPTTYANKYLSFDSDGKPTPAALSATTITQDILGDLMNPQTPTELANGITPTVRRYPDSPERYGYTGSDITADTLALQRWASAATPRKRLLDTVYQCNDRLTFAKHSIIEGCGSGLSAIDFTGANGAFSGNRSMDFSQGAFVALPALAGDLAEGDTEIEFATAHNLSQGDVIRLLDDSSGSWSGHLSTFTKGEYCIVAEIIDTETVGLIAPLYDSYTAAATDAVKFDYGTAIMQGVSILGVGTSSAVTPVFLSNCAYSRLWDVKSTAAGLRAVDVRNGYDIEADALVAHQYYEGTEVGTGQYGVSLIHCQDVRLKGNFQGERHAVTTGSTTGGGVVNRNIKVRDSQLYSLIDRAADFHGNTEWSSYDGCTIHGAVGIGGNKNSVRNCDITANPTLDSGKLISFREMKGFDFELTNLTCRTVGDPHSVGGQGVIDIGGNDSGTLNANTVLGGVLRINNVGIDAPNANAGVLIFNRGCTQECHVRVNGLDLQIDPGADTAFGLFRIDNISGGNIQSVSLVGLTGTDGVKRSKIHFDVDNIIEEHEGAGSFTPTVTFGGASVGLTYTHQTGRYELNGNTVNFWIDLLLSNKGSSSGAAKIAGLPFAAVSISNFSQKANVEASGMTFADVLGAVHNGGTSTIELREITNAGVLTAITNADFTNTTQLFVHGSYLRTY